MSSSEYNHLQFTASRFLFTKNHVLRGSMQKEAKVTGKLPSVRLCRWSGTPQRWTRVYFNKCSAWQTRMWSCSALVHSIMQWYTEIDTGAHSSAGSRDGWTRTADMKSLRVRLRLEFYHFLSCSHKVQLSCELRRLTSKPDKSRPPGSSNRSRTSDTAKWIHGIAGARCGSQGSIISLYPQSMQMLSMPATPKTLVLLHS